MSKELDFCHGKLALVIQSQPRLSEFCQHLVQPFVVFSTVFSCHEYFISVTEDSINAINELRDSLFKVFWPGADVIPKGSLLK